MAKPIVIRRELVLSLLADSEYAERLRKVKNYNEFVTLLREYAESKGYKIAEVLNGMV